MPLNTPKSFIQPKLDVPLDDSIFINHPWKKHQVKTQVIKITYLKRYVKDVDWEVYQHNTTPWVCLFKIEDLIRNNINKFPEDAILLKDENLSFNKKINTSTIYVKDYIYCNEDDLDLNEKFGELECPHLDKIETAFKPQQKIYKVYSLDIETYSIDPNQDNPTYNDPITAIALYNGDDDNHCFLLNNKSKNDFDNQSSWLNHIIEKEKILLEEFNSFIEKELNKKSKDETLIITLHYGLMFDLPHIYERLIFHDIFFSVPFNVKKKTKENTSALDIFGKPTKYLPTFIQGVDIIDTYQLAAILNKSFSDFSSLRLKDLAIREGITPETGRVELSVKELNKAVEEANYDVFLEYLFLDVYETYELFKLYFPSIKVAQKYIPLSLQEIHLKSTAYAIEQLIEYFYRYFCSGWITEDISLSDVKPDKTYAFEGGLGIVNSGIYGKNGLVLSYDINSQYPTAIELYSLCPYKDKERFFLAINKFFKNKSSELKNLLISLDKKSPKYKEILETRTIVKKYNNSGYGFTGTTGYAFNDFEIACLITAVGRAVLKNKIKTIEVLGGKLIEAATDGIKVYFENSDLTPQYILSQINERMPEGFSSGLEAQGAYLCMFRSKNYIVWENRNDVGKKDPKFVGFLNKRSTPEIYKYFCQKYLEIYYLESYEKAEIFAEDLKKKLINHELELKYLISTDKIATNHKKKSEQLEVDFGERVTYYFVEAEDTYTKTGKKRKKSPKKDDSKKYKLLDSDINSPTDDYYSLFYVYKINEFHAQFRSMLNKQYESLLDVDFLEEKYNIKKYKQLSLSDI